MCVSYRVDPGHAAVSVADADGAEQSLQSLREAVAGIGLPRAVQVRQQGRIVRVGNAPSGLETSWAGLALSAVMRDLWNFDSRTWSVRWQGS